MMEKNMETTGFRVLFFHCIVGSEIQALARELAKSCGAGLSGKVCRLRFWTSSSHALHPKAG